MKKLTYLAGSAVAFFAGTAAMANTDCSNTGTCKPPASVPEISALEGTAALAALAAIVLFTWERRRRAH